MKRLLLIIGFISLLSSLESYGQINYRHFVYTGRVALSEDRFLEALQQFNTAIQAKDDNFEAWFLRGIAKYNLGDYKGAYDDFSETIRLHPLYARAYHYRGIVSTRQSNFFEAEADFTKAISIDPYNADYHAIIGAARMQQGLYEAAIADYDMALLINPGLSHAWLNKGVANRMLEKPKEALENFNKAIYHDHFSMDAWLKRGMLRSEMNDFEGAMQDFDQALLIDHQNPVIYFQRAFVHLQKGDSLLALKDYEKVNSIDPRNALTYYNRALLHSMMDQIDLALPLFEQVTRINPQNIYGHFNLGIAQYQLKHLEEAEQSFGRVITLFPGFVGAWINRSVVRKEMGKTTAAKEDNDQAAAIIKAVGEENIPPEQLFARYADSTYFNKIIALESDFVRGDQAGTQPQYRQIDIRPFGFFILSPSESIAGVSANAYSNLYTTQLSQFFSDRFQFRYEMHDQIVLQPLTQTDTKKEENIQLFHLAIQNHLRKNFSMAAEDFAIIAEFDSTLRVAALLNLAVVETERAELQQYEASYMNDVIITTGKQNTFTETASKQAPDYQAALNTLEQLLVIQADHAFAWYNKGNILLLQQQFHPAIDAYSEAIKHEKSFGEAYYNRALTLLYLGENKLACADLSKAGEHGIAEAYAVIRRYCQQK